MMRHLGLDLGTKTIGIALSDETGYMAMPLYTLRRTGISRDMAELVALMDEREVVRVVIGLPVNMDGSKGERAAQTELFAQKLSQALSQRHGQMKTLPIIFWDERLSTVAVTRVMLDGDVSRARRKQAVDKMAAAYILQGYLDSRKNSTQD